MSITVRLVILFSCILLTYGEDYTRNPVTTTCLKSACQTIGLHYDKNMDFCRYPLKKYELKTPDPPELADSTEPLPSILRKCFLAGMRYDTTAKTCAHYTFELDEFDVKFAKRYYKDFIKEIIQTFCNISGLIYQNYYGFCVKPEEEPPQQHYYIPNLRYGENLFNKNLCFIEGLHSIEFHSVPVCAHFPERGPIIKKLRAEYQNQKDEFIRLRCPPYKEYRSELGFCIRRTNRPIYILKHNQYDMSMPRYSYFRLSKSYKDFNTSPGAASTRYAECCLYHGFNYLQFKNMCVSYLPKPTAQEALGYKRAFPDQKKRIRERKNVSWPTMMRQHV
ncbi:hypothetical protein GJ496_010814 [Pomphorhynchus laevis]|nr:hypothetical protein GJ496_010814 [Pomphorhynchus laevis]